MQVIQFPEDIGMALIKEAVNRLLDDANGVVWSPMQVCANLCKDILCDVIEWVICDHLCMHMAKVSTLMRLLDYKERVRGSFD